MKQNKNYSGQINPEKDTEYRNCNFSQPTAIEVKEVMQGVRLFPDDDTPRTFIECNLVNCQVPPESKIERCNTALIIVKDGVKTVYGNAKGLFKEPKEYIISITIPGSIPLDTVSSNGVTQDLKIAVAFFKAKTSYSF